MTADLRLDRPRESSESAIDMRSSRRYLALLLGLLALALALVLGLNLLLAERSLGGPDALQEARAWQGRTRGVTYAPPLTRSRPFKILRLQDRLPEINAMVLGSSSVMGVTQ